MEGLNDLWDNYTVKAMLLNLQSFQWGTCLSCSYMAKTGQTNLFGLFGFYGTLSFYAAQSDRITLSYNF